MPESVELTCWSIQSRWGLHLSCRCRHFDHENFHAWERIRPTLYINWVQTWTTWTTLLTCSQSRNYVTSFRLNCTPTEITIRPKIIHGRLQYFANSWANPTNGNLENYLINRSQTNFTPTMVGNTTVQRITWSKLVRNLCFVISGDLTWAWVSTLSSSALL